MSTVTFDHAGTAPARTGGTFRRALRRLTTAREARARRRVEDYMILLDDARLATFAVERKTDSSGLNGNFPW
jgi:hypothetical protein